jgi:hypothetical protein
MAILLDEEAVAVGETELKMTMLRLINENLN